MNNKTRWLTVGLIAGLVALVQAETKTVNVSTSAVTGIGKEQGVMRRDPSDIIKVDDLYYVWYSKGPLRTGYDATIWYATSPDGVNWTEKAMALAKGKPGTWEAGSVFTPNILVAEGKYWLFYSGVSQPYAKKPFNPDSKIGIAVSDSPDGPWERLASNPALSNSEDPEAFDSHLVDDACLIARDGKYWFYFKGRQAGKPPTQTKMGVAIADQPEGPYVKYKNNPVIQGNHEILAWPHGNGVAAMVGRAEPPELAQCIAYSEDGFHFKKAYERRGSANSGGGYRPENFSGSTDAKPIEWGVKICFAGPDKSKLHYIERFDIEWPEPEMKNETRSEK